MFYMFFLLFPRPFILVPACAQCDSARPCDLTRRAAAVEGEGGEGGPPQTADGRRHSGDTTTPQATTIHRHERGVRLLPPIWPFLLHNPSRSSASPDRAAGGRAPGATANPPARGDTEDRSTRQRARQHTNTTMSERTRRASTRVTSHPVPAASSSRVVGVGSIATRRASSTDRPFARPANDEEDDDDARDESNTSDDVSSAVVDGTCCFCQSAVDTTGERDVVWVGPFVLDGRSHVGHASCAKWNSDVVVSQEGEAHEKDIIHAMERISNSMCSACGKKGGEDRQRRQRQQRGDAATRCTPPIHTITMRAHAHTHTHTIPCASHTRSAIKCSCTCRRLPLV